MEQLGGNPIDEKLQMQEQLKQLVRENKKLTRQLGMLNSTIEKTKRASHAQSSLSATITKERSKQEKYMALLLENSPDIIMLFDQHSNVAYCTDTLLKRAHIKNFGLINGVPFAEAFKPYFRADWMDIIGSAIGRVIKERRLIVIDQLNDMGKYEETRIYNVQIIPMLDAEGEAEGAMVLFHDTTDILNAMEQVKMASSAKSDFLATVSHEIRTPMNAIIGISDIMKKTKLDDQQQEYLRNIERSSHVLLNLINDILDFSKIESGKLDLLEEFFGLRAMLLHLEDMFLMMFEQKELGFECEFDDNLPEVVFGDEKRLRQVLTNILNNALKYTKTGSVRFLAKTDQDGMLRFDVIDTGIGIRDEDQDRLFNAFEQLDQVKNKNIVGTGLGLAITRQLCTLMHGSVDVKSVYGEGSQFTVKVRMPIGSNENLPKTIQADFQFVAPKTRALLVDDIEINLIVAEAMLEEYQIVPDRSLSGAEAVKLASQNDYDIIFMDHMMPEMDGVEATRRIRQQGGHNEKVPIIALTANAVSGAMEMFLQNGFNGFISKPIDTMLLQQCLIQWLSSDLIET